jgi:ABC-type molybdate transport system substrate-binding protein
MESRLGIGPRCLCSPHDERLTGSGYLCNRYIRKEITERATMFRHADALRPAADRTALRPTARIPLLRHLPRAGSRSLFGYCTSSRLRLSQMAELQVAEVPREIAAGTAYGLALLRGTDPKAADLALFILSPEGQQILSRYGFASVALPAPQR